LYTYLLYKMMDEEGGQHLDDEPYGNSGLTKDGVVGYLWPQMAPEQANAYVNALFGSPPGEEDVAPVKRKDLIYNGWEQAQGEKPASAKVRSQSEAASPKRAGLKRQKTFDDRRYRPPSTGADSIPAQMFCRIAQSSLWRNVPEGTPARPPPPTVEVRRPLAERIQEQQKFVADHFKIIEGPAREAARLRRGRGRSTADWTGLEDDSFEDKVSKFRSGFKEDIQLKLRALSLSMTETSIDTELDMDEDALLADELEVSRDDLKKMRGVFASLDSDGNGTIDFMEFSGALGQLVDVSKLEGSHTKRIWDQLCVPPETKVAFITFARWYIKFFILARGKPDLGALLGKVGFRHSTAEDIAMWYSPKK
jgi:hypothetical protein